MITMFDPDDPRRARPPAEIRAEQAERDFQLARSVAMREVSDFVRGYRVCPVSACRRARRCIRASRDCFTAMTRMPLSHFEMNCAIDDVYEELRRRRRESRTCETAR
jgi:hypothetical protein